MQARPLRSAWRLQKTSVPAANSSRTDGMIKSSFFIGVTSSSNILSQVGTQNKSHGETHFPVGRTRLPQSRSPRKRASLVCSPWLPHFRWVAAVKAQPVRTLAGSAVDAPASAGLDCGQPAEYVPRKGSTTSAKRFRVGDGDSSYRAVRFIFLVRVCGEIARSMLPPIFCAMS